MTTSRLGSIAERFACWLASDAVAMMPHGVMRKGRDPRYHLAPGPRSRMNWQARRDSNPQHADLETAALPLELLA